MFMFICVHTLSLLLPSVNPNPSDLVVMVFKAFWEGLITHAQEVRGGRGPSRVPCKKTGILDKDSLVLHITDTCLSALP